MTHVGYPDAVCCRLPHGVNGLLGERRHFTTSWGTCSGCGRIALAGYTRISSPQSQIGEAQNIRSVSHVEITMSQ